MLAELSIIPVGNGSHTADELAGVLKIIDASGLPYQLTPSSTCLEGEWEELMTVVRKCHEQVRRHCPHVVTQIKIEDDEETAGKLVSNLRSVEEKAGRPLETSPQTGA